VVEHRGSRSWRFDELRARLNGEVYERPPPEPLSRERWEELRSKHLAADAKPRGRCDYARTVHVEARPYEADDAGLAVWASDHSVCCRKVARRVRALVQLKRTEEARAEAGYLFQHDRRRDACAVALSEVVAEFDGNLSFAGSIYAWCMPVRAGCIRTPSALQCIWEWSRREPEEIEQALRTLDASPLCVLRLPDGVSLKTGLSTWIAEMLQSVRHVVPGELGEWLHNNGEPERNWQGSSSTQDREAVGRHIPFGIDTKWFSGQHRFVSRVEKSDYVESWPRLYYPSDSFEQVWESVRYMAIRRATKLIASDERLDSLDMHALVQAARIAVFEARGTFNGSCKFSTYAWQAMYFAMRDETDEMNSGEHLVPFEDHHRDLWLADPADVVPDLLAARELLHKIPDLKFVVTKLVGYEDSELVESNVRVRRFRALRSVTA
jgi:hypothetical protein